ncbi:MAG: N-acetylmuramoyl-L-alanine amidase [Candidatus Omnitrophica bacterium]|nr:N-acetylmuramoyl-L-alanine amidase [Candidatus Omnitrophota bacterium]
MKRIILIFFLLGLSGCVSVPTQNVFPIYTINHVNYLPLVSVCNLKGIDLQYDTFSRTAVLIKGLNKINLMVGERLILVNGQVDYLRHPVELYQGTLMVPYSFKEILDKLLKEDYSAGKIIITPKIKKVVIDAGHGGTDPGAIGKTGLSEKTVTLDIAKRLEKLLESEGIEVIMTRSIDKSLSLSSRVEIANRSSADLFLSIHANANRVRSIHGFEVYYISPTVDDSLRAISATEDKIPNLENSCFASNSEVLRTIIWDMIYTYNRREAIDLSYYICRSIQKNLEINILGVKPAHYYVLKGARMPAILIEVGFLSNYEEERKLKNRYFRQKIAEAIVEGLKDYNFHSER